MERYRIVESVGIYFVTFTVVEWLPVFIDEISCKIVTESLNFCIQNKNLRINAYVLMPNHFHAVVFDLSGRLVGVGSTTLFDNVLKNQTLPFTLSTVFDPKVDPLQLSVKYFAQSISLNSNINQLPPTP